MHQNMRIRSERNKNPTKCCKELFEDWLVTRNGAKPKTWQTLLEKLKEIKDLHAVTEDITEELIKMNSQAQLNICVTQLLAIYTAYLFG